MYWNAVDKRCNNSTYLKSLRLDRIQYTIFDFRKFCTFSCGLCYVHEQWLGNNIEVIENEHFKYFAKEKEDLIMNVQNQENICRSRNESRLHEDKDP